VFLGKSNEKSRGFSMNDFSSLSSDDGLTYGVFCELSTMGASVDEDTHVKSWMEESAKMSRKEEGQTEGSDPSPRSGAQAPSHTLHE